jgi:2,4-dienoyl-CoA reductase (NADPH2)
MPQRAIGGQLNMAKVVPGKEEFTKCCATWPRGCKTTGVHLHLNQPCRPLTWMDFDEVVIATGVTPRDPKIPGQEHPKVLSYIDVLRHRKPVGQRVAVIGAGGIGFDVAEFLVHDGHSTTLDLAAWQAEWGVTDPAEARGGLSPEARRSATGAPGDAAAAQEGQAGRRAGQDHRLDSPHDAEDESRWR